MPYTMSATPAESTYRKVEISGQYVATYNARNWRETGMINEMDAGFLFYRMILCIRNTHCATEYKGYYNII